MPMNSIDRIRALAGAGQFGAKTLADGMNRSAPQPAAPMDPIEQGFYDMTAPQIKPMLPPDRDLNTPVEYNPITGTGSVQSPKRRR